MVALGERSRSAGKTRHWLSLDRKAESGYSPVDVRIGEHSPLLVVRLSARLVRLAVVPIGLILIGLAVVHLPPVRTRVLERVRAYAAQEFGIALQATSLRYSLFSRSVELR